MSDDESGSDSEAGTPRLSYAVAFATWRAAARRMTEIYHSMRLAAQGEREMPPRGQFNEAVNAFEKAEKGLQTAEDRPTDPTSLAADKKATEEIETLLCQALQQVQDIIAQKRQVVFSL